MQKKLLIGLLVLILLLSVACTMVACDMIGKFFNKENGGNSSSPSSSLTADTATTALRNAGYFVDIASDDDDFEDKPDGLETFISGYLDSENDEEETDFIYLFFFSSESKAKAYLASDEWAAKLEDEREDAEEDGIKPVYGRSGKYLYLGTEAALNALRNSASKTSDQSKPSDNDKGTDLTAKLPLNLTVYDLYDAFDAAGYDADYLTKEDLEEAEALSLIALFDARWGNKSEYIVVWFFTTPEKAIERFQNDKFHAELEEEAEKSKKSTTKGDLTYGINGSYIYLASQGALQILSEIAVD